MLVGADNLYVEVRIDGGDDGLQRPGLGGPVSAIHARSSCAADRWTDTVSGPNSALT